jgi:hypothetical protein
MTASQRPPSEPQSGLLMVPPAASISAEPPRGLDLVLQYLDSGSGHRSGERLGESTVGQGECRCSQCGAILPPPLRLSGRARRFCSARCRSRASLRRTHGLPETLPILGQRGRAPLARIVELLGRTQ